jgi:hypothetical protein
LLKARAPAAVGVVHKTPDKFVVHPKGKWLEADAGEMVQINVAKYFLVPVTQADADYCLATKCVAPKEAHSNGNALQRFIGWGQGWA